MTDVCLGLASIYATHEMQFPRLPLTECSLTKGPSDNQNFVRNTE